MPSFGYWLLFFWTPDSTQLAWAYSCTFRQHFNLASKINDLTDCESVIENAHFAWANAASELDNPKTANMSIGTGSQKDSFPLVPRTVLKAVLLSFLSPGMETPPAIYGCLGT
jgi:hypothetical protein